MSAAIALAAGSAAALRSFQVSNPGALRGTGTNISFEEEAGFLRTVCSGATLNGEGRERIPKTVGAVAGTVTEGRTTGCRAFGFEATVTLNAEPRRPWQTTYSSFLGTLPNITGVLGVSRGGEATIIAGGRTCRYAGEPTTLSPVTRGAAEMTSFTGGIITLQAGSSESCPRQGILRGSFRAERVRTVTLV
jgi:hypothetical protein